MATKKLPWRSTLRVQSNLPVPAQSAISPHLLRLFVGDSSAPDSPLRQQTLDQISRMWASSTWRTRQSLWRRFEEFRSTQPASESLGMLMAMFVESLEVTPQTKHNYAKALSAVATRMQVMVPEVRMYTQGLLADGAGVPIEQAAPMTREQLNWIMSDPACPASAPERMAIFVAWKTASRWDDVAQLTKESFLVLRDDEIIIDWAQHTKSSRLDPFRPSRWTVIRHRLPLSALSKFVQNLPAGAKFTSLTTTRLTGLLHAYQPTANLSAHSIKRGAATVLAQAALEGRLDLTLLPLVLKHQTALPALPATTLRYIADGPLIARTLRTQDATLLL